MNKKDFQDGDVVSFLDTPYNSHLDRMVTGLTGTVVYQDNVLGLLVRVDGLFTQYEDRLLQDYVYYLSNKIQCVKV